MKLTYQLSLPDLVAFNLYHVANSKLHKKQIRVRRFLIPVMYLIISILFISAKIYFLAFFFSAFAILWFLFWPSYQRRHYKHHFQKHFAETVGDALKEPGTLELQDDGIHSTSHIGQALYKYSAVDKIVEDNGYTYIYIGKGMALILPQDRIPSDEINKFIILIQKRKEAASKN